MCGICGYTGRMDRSALERMMRTMVHRGPDGSGVHAAPDVSLGMRRLAIVDLESGGQPAYNEDGTIAVVFNGEIFNHQELRAELEEQGHRFRSHHSDTEVLVHLYEQHGPGYLDRLNGMFAIALWDGRRKELHLARDRAGVKPLYLRCKDGRLWFGSEIKAILAHPDVSARPDFGALARFFALKNVAGPASAFEGIEQLRPGERAVFRDGRLERVRWWRLRFSPERECDDVEAAGEVRRLLEDSVRLRMQCDVPFGAYLSGGLDSSSVVALMSRQSSQPIKTFSLTYERSYMLKDRDREYARQVSAMYGTDHAEHVMTHRELVDSMDGVVASFDEPFSGVTSTYFLTRLIGRHVKVALSGDGADELFGSYLAHRIAAPLAAYDIFVERGGEPTSEERAIFGSFGGDMERLHAVWSAGGEPARRAALGAFGGASMTELLSDEMLALIGEAGIEAYYADAYGRADTTDPLNRALSVDFETLLPDQVLAFVDRLSMAHSVEVRTPFLDYRLMEFVARLPGSMKIRGARTKHILKEAVRDLLPPEIIDRPKEGFVLPINDWLREDLRPFVLERLSPDRIARHGLLRQARVAHILEEHFSGRKPSGPAIWSLINFQAWWERYFEGFRVNASA